MIGTVAPIRDRRVIVDAHRVDVVAGKERIEGKAHLVAAVEHMRAVFGPVRRIDDGSPGAEDRPHVAC